MLRSLSHNLMAFDVCFHIDICDCIGLHFFLSVQSHLEQSFWVGSMFPDSLVTALIIYCFCWRRH